MKAMPQGDGANDEIISKKHAKKKPKMIKVSLQLDGTGPPVNYFSFFRSHLKMTIFYVDGR